MLQPRRGAALANRSASAALAALRDYTGLILRPH